MTPEQQNFLKSLITGVGPQALSAFPGLLKGYSEDTFQQGVVDPAMKVYQNQVLPGIEQRFTDANAGSSSALNQALIQSSDDLSNILAGQRINYQQMAGNQQLGALGQIMSLLNNRSFDPIVQGPQGGMLKDLIGAGGQIGAAMMMSSRAAKTNIKEYEKGLEILEAFDVKQYDYIFPVDGRRTDRVGLIAEELPKEITANIDGLEHVDLYGLVGVLINSVKQLSEKVKRLEAV